MNDEVASLRAEVARLKQYISHINTYDRTVQAVISSHPVIKDRWDDFCGTYMMLTDDTLLRTAEDKINHHIRDQNHNVCPTCHLAKVRGVYIA